jgi:hypothetical protein
VGVRFGGSEHHRIETSSSHTRPPPVRAGTPGHRDTANGAPRGTARTVSTGQGTGPLRRAGPPPHPGRSKRSSSERRARRLTGVRQPTLFGASRVGPHRDREPPALRSRRPPIPPGQGTHTSSEAWRPRLDPGQSLPPARSRAPGPPGPGRRHPSGRREPSLTGAQQTEFFGAPGAAPHRDREPPALRSRRRPTPRDREPPALRSRRPPTPSEQEDRTSSEAPGDPFHPGQERPASLGQGTASSSEPTAPHPNRDGSPAPLGQGKRASSEARAPRLAGVRQTELLGAPGVGHHRDREPPALRSRRPPTPRDREPPALRSRRPPTPLGQGPGPPRRIGPPPRLGAGSPASRGTADGTPRSAARRVSPGQRTRSSSERRAPRPAGAGSPELFGATAAPPRSRQDRPSHRATGHPAPRGRAARRPAGRDHGCTSPASAGGGRQGHRPRSGPAPGRTVTTGRQRPQ